MQPEPHGFVVAGQAQASEIHFFPFRHSPSPQQPVVATHFVGQVLRAPQLQLPPEQVPPVPQSPSIQQPLPAWHEPLHTRLPAGHSQEPPSHCCPVTAVQSPSAQQAEAAMQVPSHARVSLPHSHW